MILKSKIDRDNRLRNHKKNLLLKLSYIDGYITSHGHKLTAYLGNPTCHPPRKNPADAHGREHNAPFFFHFFKSPPSSKKHLKVRWKLLLPLGFSAAFRFFENRARILTSVLLNYRAYALDVIAAMLVFLNNRIFIMFSYVFEYGHNAFCLYDRICSISSHYVPSPLIFIVLWLLVSYWIKLDYFFLLQLAKQGFKYCGVKRLAYVKMYVKM